MDILSIFRQIRQIGRERPTAAALQAVDFARPTSNGYIVAYFVGHVKRCFNGGSGFFLRFEV